MNFTVKIETIYGIITVEDITADTEEQAFDIACKKVKEAVDCSNIAQIEKN